jgi:flagellar biosynthesis protein FlhG
MPKFEELTYYELLEIPINASTFEIRQAYKEALAIYGPESTVAYSFFVEEEREEILKKVEDAFATLMDEKNRSQYDKRLLAEKRIDPSDLKPKKGKRPTPIFAAKASGQANITKVIEDKIEEKDVKEMTDELLSRDMISGSDLKRVREAAGIRINDVFEVTRITVAILEAIENDDLETLPSDVYLKNFLRAYAKLFKMDGDKLIEGYLNNLGRIRGAC